MEKKQKGTPPGPQFAMSVEMQWIIMIFEKTNDLNRTSQDWRIYLFTKNMFGQAC